MKKFVTFGPAFVVLVTTLVTLIAVPAAVRRIGFATTDVRVRLAHASLAQDSVLEQINQAVRNISTAVEPSVVHISTSAPSGSMGSGWVFDTAGHIVTNAHVVSGASQISVQFNDGRTLSAEFVGADEATDIAVIRLSALAGLVPVQRATGAPVQQGDRVFAFGSPFGFKFSMSEGIVSGLGRDPRAVIGFNGYTNFIQTDAAVNPGNSGGPLVDINARLVGMNVAIATGADPGGTRGQGQSSGISFAIPLATIESVVNQLITTGAVSKGYLGISLPDGRDPDAAEQYNLALLRERNFIGRGVCITRVEPQSPAEAAGLKSGDIITSINGSAAFNVGVLRSLITNHRAAEVVHVTLWREGQSLELPVTLGDLARNQPGFDRARIAIVKYGITVARVSDTGVLIQAVTQGSQAESAGITTGTRIASIDGKSVREPDELVWTLAEAGFANGRRLPAVLIDAEGKERAVELLYKP